MIRRTSVFALCFAALMITSCFEGPARERLWIEILDDGQARVTARSEVDRTRGSESPGVRQRAEALRTSLQNGTDFWAGQFARLDSIEDRTIIEREEGIVTAVERSALVELEGLEAIFDGSSISMFVTREHDWTELTIYSGESDRASREQRETLTRYLRAWSGELEEYFAALDRLVRYLELNPHRRELVWSAVFSELPEPEWEELLATHEKSLVEELDEAIERTWEVFALEEEEALSLQEIGYLVYDPFPSDVQIEVPGEALEIEGFRRSDDAYTIERIGLWEAFDALRENVVTHDPLTFWMNQEDREEGESLTELFLESEVRIHSTPTATEILEALEHQLRPEKTYRLRW